MGCFIYSVRMILIIASWRRWALLTGSLLLVASCSDPVATEGPRVVATTSILADVTRSLGIPVETLMPDGVDPHDFEPTARDLAALRSADLIVAFGLGLEEGLEKTLDSVREAGVEVLEVGPLVEPLPLPGGGVDPHVWTDPIRVAEAVRSIGEGLTRVDPSRDWSVPVAALVSDLVRLDDEIRTSLAGVENRRLVTDHRVLGYFAARYDFEVVGSLVPSTSSLAAPSARDISGLIDEIREDAIPAVFIQPGGPVDLAETVAAQVGFPVSVIEVRVESLGPPGNADSTYRGLMLELSRAIAEGLG